MFCSRPRGWVIKAKPTGQIMLGGIFHDFQHFQSFIMHSLHWAMHGVWFESASIHIDSRWKAKTNSIYLSKTSSRTTPVFLHCVWGSLHFIPWASLSWYRYQSMFIDIDILGLNLFLISISISVLLTSILWTNLVIFHLLKVFIVAVCVTWVLLFIEEINKTRL